MITMTDTVKTTKSTAGNDAHIENTVNNNDDTASPEFKPRHPRIMSKALSHGWKADQYRKLEEIFSDDDSSAVKLLVGNTVMMVIYPAAKNNKLKKLNAKYRHLIETGELLPIDTGIRGARRTHDDKITMSLSMMADVDTTVIKHAVDTCEWNPPKPRRSMTISEVCEKIGCPENIAPRVIHDIKLDSSDIFGNRYHEKDVDHAVKRYGGMVKINELIREVTSEQENYEQQIKELNARQEDIRDHITVSVGVRPEPSGDDEHHRAIIMSGPTNSGKTHDAISELIAAYKQNPDGRYVYAGPLRMLAWEVYNRIGDEIGLDNVGFVTGEEQVNASATVSCCTVEMAPMRGDLLIIDEAHWLSDPDRGKYWTDLIIGSEYKTIIIITAEEAVPIVKRILVNIDDVDEQKHKRLTPLSYGGPVDVSEVKPRTAVVAFSRKSVIALARIIKKRTKLHVGVLYGRLPIQVRQDVIHRYEEGLYDVIVTTDVIGHGINLPIDHLIFAETEKFDGVMRRPLYSWEAAQIAGRSGRYGLSDTGTVHVLTGPYWLNNSAGLVRNATSAATGRTRTDLRIRTAYASPRFDDLNVTAPVDVMPALTEWARKADDELEHLGVSAAPLNEHREIIMSTASSLTAPLSRWDTLKNPVDEEKYEWEREEEPYYYSMIEPENTDDDEHNEITEDNWGSMSGEDLWRVGSSPLDPRSSMILSLSLWLAASDRDDSTILLDKYRVIEKDVERLSVKGVRHDGEWLWTMEESYRDLCQMRAMSISFGSMGRLSDDSVNELIDSISGLISSHLDACVTQSGYGKCAICGDDTAPWYEYCDDCHSSMRSYGGYGYRY